PKAARGRGGMTADSPPAPAGLDGALETDPSSAPGAERVPAEARASASSQGPVNAQTLAQLAALGKSWDWKWDWAIRRLDQHLSHPAQQYLAEALAAEALAAEEQEKEKEQEQEEDREVERRDEEGGRQQDRREQTSALLLTAAERALAPASVGGAACGGANLAWYLQYSEPRLLKPGKAGAARLRLLPSDVEGIPAAGQMYAWNLLGGSGAKGARPRSWAAVISGSSPCSAFRVWLSVKVDYPAAAAAAGRSTADGSAAGAGLGASRRGAGSSDGERERAADKLEAEARRALEAPARSVRHDVEVTSLAAPLPAVAAKGRWLTRQRSEWYDIGKGRDYQSRAGWLLLLPRSILLPLLEQSGGAPLVGSLWNGSLRGEGPRGDGSRRDGNNSTGDGSGSGRRGKEDPVVTLQLTLWLAAPTYQPAFHVRAEAFPAPALASAVAAARQCGSDESLAPVRSLQLSMGQWKRDWERWSQSVMKERAPMGLPWPPPPPLVPPPQQLASQQRQLLVSLSLPYLTNNNPSVCPTDLMACVVRWLGLYKYAAVQISLAGERVSERVSEPVLDGKGSARGGPHTPGSCLYPTVILAGGGGGGAEDLVGSRPARFLQISANQTLHSLEACTSDPWGCSVVTVLLDPTCDYELHLVPYAAERLAELLLAHVSHLWIGAQLAALLAVVEAAAAAAMAAARATAAVPAGLPALTERVGGRRMILDWRLFGWPSLAWEAICVLQAGLLRRKTFTLLLATAALAAAAAAVLPQQDHPVVFTRQPLPILQALRSLERIYRTNGANGNSSTFSQNGTHFGEREEVPLTTGTQTLLRALAEHVHQLARDLHLCTQPQRADCGWGVTLVRLSWTPWIVVSMMVLPARLAAMAVPPLLSFLAATSPPRGPGGPVPASDYVSVLDWAAMAGVALLLVWVLALLLHVINSVVVTVEAVVKTCWKALVRILTLFLPLSSWTHRHRHRLRHSSRDEANADADADARSAALIAEETEQKLSTEYKLVLSCGWCVLLPPLAVLMTLAGTQLAVPNLAMLLSVINLAISLRAPPSPPAPPRSHALETGEAGGLAAAARYSWQLQERRRRIAWLLYYTAHVTATVPAVVAAFRRVVLRWAGVMELLSAVTSLAQSGWQRALEEPSLLPLLFGGESLTWLSGLIRGIREQLSPGLLHWLVTSAQSGHWQIADGGVYLLAVAHCCVLAWQGAGAAAARPGRGKSRIRRAVAWLASLWRALCSGLLALSWWLGSADAAHYVLKLLTVGELLSFFAH
ncbi:hypothetical protein Vretifemale_9200, partial [Volvox reticuliferus]